MVRCDLLKKVDLQGMEDFHSIEIFYCRSLEKVILDDLQNLVWLDIFVGIKSYRFPTLKGLVSLQVYETMWCNQ